VVTVAFDIPSSTIKDLRFLGPDGSPLETSSRSTMSMGDSCQLEYAHPSPWPESGSVVVDKYKELQEYRAAFEIRDIDLLGRPK
jgi:hypothetical protein